MPSMGFCILVAHGFKSVSSQWQVYSKQIFKVKWVYKHICLSNIMYFFKQDIKKDLLAIDGHSPVIACSENFQPELGLGIRVYPFHLCIKSMNLEFYFD